MVILEVDFVFLSIVHTIFHLVSSVFPPAKWFSHVISVCPAKPKRARCPAPKKSSQTWVKLTVASHLNSGVYRP